MKKTLEQVLAQQEALKELLTTPEHDAQTIAEVIAGFANWPLSRTRNTVKDCEAIAAHPNPARNLMITQSYHDLTLGMADVIGHEHISWVGVATWASKTAGIFIRDEEIPDLMWRAVQGAYARESWRERVLGRILGWAGSAWSVESLLARFFESCVRHVSTQIAAGNTKVYNELGPLFADAIARFSQDEVYNEETIRGFCARLRDGETTEGEESGQDLLKLAFRSYYAARFEADPHKKAQLVLLANAATGLHEQIRLQPAIHGSLNAPFAVVGALERFVSDQLKERLPVQLHVLIDVALWFLAPVMSRMDDLWMWMATELLMVLVMPGRILRLGQDLRPQMSGGRAYPQGLESIDNPQLKQLLLKYDRNPEGLSGSGTRRWDDLYDRMNYILELFRIHQCDATLFVSPFDEAQRAKIYAGELPEGPL